VIGAGPSFDGTISGAGVEMTGGSLSASSGAACCLSLSGGTSSSESGTAVGGDASFYWRREHDGVAGNVHVHSGVGAVRRGDL
jgi:hypothetical protein